MGWINSSDIPNWVTWSDWVTGATKKPEGVAYRTQARIARGSESTVYVQVRMQAYCRDYGSSPKTVTLKAQVSVGNTSSYETSSAVTGSVTFGTDDNAMQNVGSRYYQATLAEGGKAYARTYLSGSSQSGSVTLTGPAYTTTYTVTYKHGTGSSGADVTQSKKYGSSVTIYNNGAYTRTGYAFTKWNTAENGSGTNYSPGASYSTNANLTLYAQWAPNTYTVSYNANGGSGAPASQTKTYGATLVLSSTVPTRTGYRFLKWNTASDGSGTSYQPGASFTTNANTTLYAIWELMTYAVSYDGNGADSGSVAAQTKTYNAPLVLQQNGFTRQGFAFTGWNTAPDGSGTSYAAGGTYSANEAAVLYAQWVRANIPAYVNVGGQVYQVDQAYANVDGAIVECDVYVNVGGEIKQIL